MINKKIWTIEKQLILDSKVEELIEESWGKAIKDDSVKALVLRVNSRGGGVYPSELITNALNEFTNGLQNHAVQTGIATVMLKETFKKKKESQLIGLSVFTFILVLSLLFKYFNVIPNIWNFIVKK